ncbi:hypothetical protein GC194_04755 [bacterium]|nr:hypothetical protein [bacterium]
MKIPDWKLNEFDRQFTFQLRQTFPNGFPWLFVGENIENVKFLEIEKESNFKLKQLQNHKRFSHEYERDFKLKFLNEEGVEKQFIFTNWVYFNLSEAENRHSIEILDPYEMVIRNHMDVIHSHTQKLEIIHLDSEPNDFFKGNAVSEIMTQLRKVKWDKFNDHIFASDIHRDVLECSKLIGEASLLSNFIFQPEGIYYKEVGKTVFPYSPTNYDVNFFRAVTYFAFNVTAVWDKCASMITQVLNLEIPLHRRSFKNVMEKLEENLGENGIDEFEWLNNFVKKDYPIIAKIRNANAHGQNIELAFLNDYLKGITKRGKICNLIDQRNGYLKTMQIHQELMIEGIEKCIRLVQKLGEPNPYTNTIS